MERGFRIGLEPRRQRSKFTNFILFSSLAASSESMHQDIQTTCSILMVSNVQPVELWLAVPLYLTCWVRSTYFREWAWLARFGTTVWKGQSLFSPFATNGSRDSVSGTFSHCQVCVSSGIHCSYPRKLWRDGRYITYLASHTLRMWLCKSREAIGIRSC